MGGRLPEVTVAYETYGRLNPQARQRRADLPRPVRRFARRPARRRRRSRLVGHRRRAGQGRSTPTATSSSARTSSAAAAARPGPNSINPATGRPYGTDFPVITVGDIVEVQRRLVDHLGIERLLAVVGGSLGGHMVLTWATRFPAARGRRGRHGHLAAADQPGPGLRRRRPQRHPPRSGLPRRAILRPRPRARRWAWPSRGCSGTSPTSRARR